MEEMTEERRKELLAELVARKDSVLQEMEIETITEGAANCVREQRSRLLNLANALKLAKFETEEGARRFRVLREEAVISLSENFHPTVGKQFQDTEPTEYINILQSFEDRINKDSDEVVELLTDRLRLGHVVQQRIPFPSLKFLKMPEAVLVSLAEDIKHSLKNSLTRPSISLEAKTYNVFVSWHSELKEIIENLNISLADLFGLVKQPAPPCDELWNRYRYSARMYLYEFGRIRMTLKRFLKELWQLKHIDQARRLWVEEFWFEITSPMTEVRNQIYHSHMPIADHEKRAMVSTLMVLSVGSIMLEKETGQTIDALNEIKLLAEKIATEFYQSRNAIALLQMITQEQFEMIMEHHPEWARAQ